MWLMMRHQPLFISLTTDYNIGKELSGLRSTAAGGPALTVTEDVVLHAAASAIMPQMKQASSLATAVLATLLFLLVPRTR